MQVSSFCRRSTLIGSLLPVVMLLSSQGISDLLAQERPIVRARVGCTVDVRTHADNSKMATPENTFGRRMRLLSNAAYASERQKKVVVGLVDPDGRSLVIPLRPRPVVARVGDGSLEPIPSAAIAPDFSSRPQSVVSQVGGGIVGGAGGLVLGAFYGVSMALDGDGWDCTGDLCAVGTTVLAIIGGVMGAAVGEPLGLACGVHLANGRQGDMRRDIAVSGMIAALGVGIALRTEEASVLIAVPIAQLVGVVATERATAARRSRRDVKWCHL